MCAKQPYLPRAPDQAKLQQALRAQGVDGEASLEAAHLDRQFRLLREDNDKSTNDDIILISKAAGDLYNVCYNDQQAGVKMNTQNLTASQVQTFLSNTFRLLQVDNQPFHNLQVTLPGLPSIMVAPEDLDSQTRDLIYDSVEMVMENWPILA